MLLYKLTTQANTTFDDTLWGEGVTHTAKGAGTQLCSSDVIHAYEDPLLAVLLNPIHANIQNPKLWEADGTPVTKACDKVGCKSLTTKQKVPLPRVTIDHRVRFAIGCALQAYKNPAYRKWALAWLSGKDRSYRAAADAAAAARVADDAVDARVAADAACAAACAAHAAHTVCAAHAACAARARADAKEIAKWSVSDAPVEELPGFVLREA
jgi:hypothetical protein